MELADPDDSNDPAWAGTDLGAHFTPPRVSSSQPPGPEILEHTRPINAHKQINETNTMNTHSKFFSTTICLMSAFYVWEIHANADLIVYDDEQSFVEAGMPEGIMSDGLADIADGSYAKPIRRHLSDDLEYAIASTSYVGLTVENEIISTLLPKSDLNFKRNTMSLQSIGGYFSLTNLAGILIGDVFELRLQDGESVLITIDSAPTFVGIVAVDEPLISFELGALSNPPLIQVESVLLSSKQLPTPSVLATLLMDTLLSIRSRRRPLTKS